MAGVSSRLSRILTHPYWNEGKLNPKSRTTPPPGLTARPCPQGCPTFVTFRSSKAVTHFTAAMGNYPTTPGSWFQCRLKRLAKMSSSAEQRTRTGVLLAAGSEGGVPPSLPAPLTCRAGSAPFPWHRPRTSSYHTQRVPEVTKPGQSSCPSTLTL